MLLRLMSIVVKRLSTKAIVTICDGVFEAICALPLLYRTNPKVDNQAITYSGIAYFIPIKLAEQKSVKKTKYSFEPL